MKQAIWFLWLWGAVAVPAMAQDGVSAGVATNAVEKAAPAGTAAAEVTPPPRMPTGDPFAMRGLTDDEGFVSAGPAALPPGIRVVGILAVAGKEPVGAISIPGVKNLYFVREGDIVQVDRAAGGGAAAGATDAQLYLLVKSVTASQIEIAPRTRPQDVRIYR
ncbi:hypothetical protein [Kiritimatiella glycovorans]|uniref:Uncharacterized protein n=1 Tax=Kiritimatiella glycovorans TaxID=1307763 RepID=A0A0G3EEV0_9BACT|nr:hypothetical protein [Kiritimatiella glycovorans]AKJ64833.1 hypothetical protein L21SP4_01590 [Kiritimatiella glycovorans]